MPRIVTEDLQGHLGLNTLTQGNVKLLLFQILCYLEIAVIHVYASSQGMPV